MIALPRPSLPNPRRLPRNENQQVIVIHADEGPDQAVIVADNAATEEDSRLLDVVFVIDGEGLLVAFHVREPRCNLGWTLFRIVWPKSHGAIKNLPRCAWI